ncbi:hypothetical protein IE077_002977 [Cardiosporidium cionae]|uniref:Uncharacterized protein n=1 Tax=Cardiosporidium cionae TaxID=476202 RepID=A0ABQ7J9H3_9APIC|nr:hypothetical protein IE077_002977 [Cardiosporidium cionae]|eukprot:KAF8820644.1 hypothetical protein IE077_002977 [Cardiosporidium cionae]
MHVYQTTFNFAHREKSKYTVVVMIKIEPSKLHKLNSSLKIAT